MMFKKLRALEISLTVGCNVSCKYCPQELFIHRYLEQDKMRTTTLSFDNFKRILMNVQEGGSIAFCGMSEPFANKACADMIVYAYHKGYKISLLTTLVGMTKEDYEKIKEIDFESLVLHIPDQEGNSKIRVGDEYIDKIKRIMSDKKVSYYSCHGSLHSDIEQYIDKNETIISTLHDRAGNLQQAGTMKSSDKEGDIVCRRGGTMYPTGHVPVVLPDGTLLLCCQDWGMKCILGNLLTETWEEISKNEPYQMWRKSLCDEKKEFLCRKCMDAVEVKELPAVRLKEKISEFRNGNDCIGANSVAVQIANAKKICVWGMGKLFWDIFWEHKWNEGLEPEMLTDSNPAYHHHVYNGVKCIEPAEALADKDIFVVVFVRNPQHIVEMLKNNGISSYVTYEEIMKEFQVK